jgi:KAP family P-loop domain
MSLATTKDHLIKLLDDKENKVVALSGKWGTGKTHLWNEVKDNSGDDKVKNALYVSLFGLSSIDQVKRRLIESAIPGVESHGGMFDGLKSLFKFGIKVGSEHYKALAAINDLNVLLMAPVVLRSGVIVIDDIERKHEKLGIDEVLGFIDEYSKQYESRFVLVLNDDQLKSNVGTWNEMREKVIDQELQLDTTPEEAFDIAAKLIQPKHNGSALIKKAVVRCEISNIRIIKKIIRVINNLLEGHGNLTGEILARLIPSTVLLSAIYYKGLNDGPDFDFVLKNGALDSISKPQDNDENATEEKRKQDRWRSLLFDLGVYSADDLEPLIVKYLKSGMFEVEAVSSIISGYINDDNILKIQNQSRQLFQDIWWSNKLDPELLTEAKLFVANAHYIDAYNITALHNLLNEYFVGTDGVADELINHWIEKCKNQPHRFQNFDDDPFGRPLHPLIKQMITERKAKAISATTFADALEIFVYKSSWSNEELARIKSATTQDFESILTSSEGKLKSLTVSKFVGYCNKTNQNEVVLGDAPNRFIEACKIICTSDRPELRRLGVTIKSQFTNAEKLDLLQLGE